MRSTGRAHQCGSSVVRARTSPCHNRNRVILHLQRDIRLRRPEIARHVLVRGHRLRAGRSERRLRSAERSRPSRRQTHPLLSCRGTEDGQEPDACRPRDSRRRSRDRARCSISAVLSSMAHLRDGEPGTEPSGSFCKTPKETSSASAEDRVAVTPWPLRPPPSHTQSLGRRATPCSTADSSRSSPCS